MAISLFRSFSLRDVLKLALLPVFAGILSAQGPEFKLQQLPLNPAYLEWQAKQRERAEMAALGFTVEADDTTSFRTGYIPPPFLWPKVDGPLTQIEAMVNAGLATFDSMHFIGDPSASTYWSTYLRDIKNQNPYGTCWAFAALASMESNILLNGGAGVDFSPRHLAWFAYNPINGYPAFPTGGVSGTEIFNNGGHSQMALAIMSRGPGAGGPVAETSAPYSGMPAAPSASATAIATVTGTYFPGTLDGKNTGDRTAIKGLICTHGAVAVAINMAQDSAHFNSSTSAYRNTATGTNHGVNVVGWDDNYPLSNFPAGNQPTSHGAWIIRNSWGTGFGDGGYFYVSYDTFLDDFASFEASTQIDSKVYQHDMLGARAYYSMSQKTVWFSNIFTATGNQGVTGVAFYTGYNNASYEITVKTGVTGDPNTGTVVLGPVSGMVGLPGYQRVYLPSPAVVASGQQFAVIVKLTENTNADIYCTGGAVSGGRTYISSSGSYWQNTTSDAGICLKAFAESASLTSVTFTATQTGGTSDTTNSTGIALNFSQAVSGLTASNINITNGTGSVTKGTLTGSGTSWNIGVTVATQGNVSVSISDFGGFSVTTSPQTVAVYKALPTPVTFTAIQKGGTSNTADTTG
ncbi:MAG: lectin like domain-containing protein, partial [Holophagaceae bacterium]|nr:lectin like domain-containing protein [Holophagaceae bacterium]